MYDDIVEKIIANPAGGTESLVTGQMPTAGYLVGGAAPSLVFQDAAQVRHYPDLVDAYLANIAYGGATLVGWWTDPETGKIHLDVVTWHASEITAGEQATLRGEIAYRDVAGQCDVRTEAV